MTTDKTESAEEQSLLTLAPPPELSTLEEARIKLAPDPAVQQALALFRARKQARPGWLKRKLGW